MNILIRVLMGCIAFIITACWSEGGTPPMSGTEDDICELPAERIIKGTKQSLIISLDFLSEKLGELSADRQHALLATYTKNGVSQIKKCMDSNSTVNGQADAAQLAKTYIVLSAINDKVSSLIAENKEIKEEDLELMRAMLH